MTAHGNSLPLETRTAGRSAHPGKSRTRSWRVIHACENARAVLPVAESQVAAGMQPYIVTPQGAGKAELFLSAATPEPYRRLSLLRSWQQVRQWRKSILDCDPENSADLVHAHSFPAGMAAVRNCSCVVYDFVACIEELAASARPCDRRSWLAGTFLAAEQFVLIRAAAVIVHSTEMKRAALERGVSLGSIFLISLPRPGEDDLPTLVQLVKKDGEV